VDELLKPLKDDPQLFAIDLRGFAMYFYVAPAFP